MPCLRLLAGAALVVPIAACSSGAEPSAAKSSTPPLVVCEPFSPCHAGSVVGQWRLDHVCLDEAYLRIVKACGNGVSSIEEITGYAASGTLDIAADGSASLHTEERAYERYSNPAECSADPAAAKASCDARTADGFRCTLTAGDCECDAVLTSAWPTPSSTFMPGDATLFGMDYCVNGAGLTLRKQGGAYVFVPG